jgi:hypothetical protein
MRDVDATAVVDEGVFIDEQRCRGAMGILI